MFAKPPDIETRVFASLPDKFRRSARSDWAHIQMRGRELDSFLEGPSLIWKEIFTLLISRLGACFAFLQTEIGHWSSSTMESPTG